MVRPFVYPLSWKTPPGPGHASGSSSLSPWVRGSRSSWHREQFPAIARNCRTDGGDFLLGVRREAEIVSATKSACHPAAPGTKAERRVENPAATHAIAAPTQVASPAAVRRTETASAGVKPTPAPSRGLSREPFQNAVAMAPPRLRTETHTQGTSARPERTVMQPKTMFPHFWRRKQDEDAPAKSTTTEAPVNKPNTQEATPSGPRGELPNMKTFTAPPES
jgi:hypothetical protein